jgi:hypothetical protein
MVNPDSRDAAMQHIILTIVILTIVGTDRPG